MSRLAFGIATLAFVAFVAPAYAQEQPVRVRGTVERVDEGLYVIKARNGGEVKVKLADNAMVVAPRCSTTRTVARPVLSAVSLRCSGRMPTVWMSLLIARLAKISRAAAAGNRLTGGLPSMRATRGVAGWR